MIPGINTGGGGFSADMGSSATSGDVYSTSNTGGLNVSNGLSIPSWATGVALVGGLVLGGIYLWKKK